METLHSYARSNHTILEIEYHMNYRIILLIVLPILVFLACQSNSNSSTSDVNDGPYVAMSGKEAYDMYCVACHGADGKMNFSGATDLSKSSLDLATRILQIKNGKGVMNAFNNILNDEEIENVAVYIEDLRK
ncbi:MAG: mono/diheme cytochrome c family protein [Chitinophagales bacterium]|jgi:mono/diheme cytochrome c family protein